jgi:hypothetical protein
MTYEDAVIWSRLMVRFRFNASRFLGAKPGEPRAAVRAAFLRTYGRG